ncbi:MAG: hypothetical protein E3J81_04400 [Dehalococcoidia bacterium]|nr:MAG: hypothetical protein E3J81_04400 [Dehalococcoidia bacterium]
MNSEQDYMKLLDLLARVVEANKGPIPGADDRLADAENLANKFFAHAASVLYLSRGTRVELSISPSGQLEFLDPASVDVLARAAFEAFLVFHYIFIAPDAPKEKKYRYWAWKIAGLTERQKLPVSTEEHRQKLAEDKKNIYKLHSKLRSNAVFQQLTGKQQNQVLEEGKWRLLPGYKKQMSWRQIATNAGLAKILSSDMYRHLSGYAHSGSISIRQILKSLENKERFIIMGAAMNLITIAIANFIRKYCDLLPRAKAALTADTEGSEMVDMCIQIGQQLSFGDKSS